MSTVKIEINNGATAFLPGDKIPGIAMWQMDTRPKNVTINLFWYTSGKGTRDIETVSTIELESPSGSDAHSFEFTAPDGPYSFSGTYVSIQWGIELVTKELTDRADITISSTGEKVNI